MKRWPRVGRVGVSERGLLAQRRAMHNTVLHGIAERSIHLADSAGAEDDTEEENGRMFNAALARQFQEFMQMRGVVPTIELPEGDEAVQEKITLAKEYARREGATMRATSRMWLPRDQTAQWTGSVENVFSCVEFDRFSGGRFLACGGEVGRFGSSNLRYEQKRQMETGGRCCGHTRRCISLWQIPWMAFHG